MDEIRYCDRCGCEIPADEGEEFCGVIYCDECLDNTTGICTDCGRRIDIDDNCGDNDTILCSRCYSSNYTHCEECGELISISNTYYIDDDDTPYCSSCYDEKCDGVIHQYSYKPEPIFFGKGNRYMGVELEIDYGGKDARNATRIQNAGNSDGEYMYIKTDGSLDDGLELVTHPMTLEFHRNDMPWQSITDTARDLGYKSHRSSTCGLHVHINRTAFGRTREMQDECISRVLYFVEHHWEELLKFSRRTQSQMNRWAARYGYKATPKEVLESAKKGYAGRYTCVNITNYNTIEFRMFRGTLKVNTIIATLELIDVICDLAINMNDEEISGIGWTDFVGGIDEKLMPELVTYLKERQLYINEPVEVKEDD